jgi:hypothetical protein
MNTKLSRILSVTLPVGLMIFLSGCLKTHEGFTDFSTTSDFVLLTGAGTGNFKAANISVNTSSPDTIRKTVTADLASKNNDNGPVTVTLGLDAAALTAYNTANGTNFQPFPSNAYKILNSTLTIPAGQHYASTTVEIYQNKLDPTISYMLPISIKDGGGKQLSNNQNTIYYNVIGNPIAGAYKWDFTRWGNPNQTGSPDISFVGHTTSFVPDSPTQIEVASGYYIGPRYVLSFTNTNGVLSNFKVTMNADDVATMAGNGVTISNGPNIVKADPITGEYIFQYTTPTRYVIDRYYK